MAYLYDLTLGLPHTNHRGLSEPRHFQWASMAAATGGPLLTSAHLDGRRGLCGQGKQRLRVAPPVGADFSALPSLPNDENPYHFTRAASETGQLGLLDESWIPLEPFEHHHALDIDRDTNGAGLIYFAQYVTFMDTAERLAIANRLSGAELVAAGGRSLRHRRIAYYGNADVSDTITIRVTLLRQNPPSRWMGVRYAVERQQDGQTICLSEALKHVGPT